MLYEEYVPPFPFPIYSFLYYIIVFYPGNLEKQFHKNVLAVINTAYKTLLLEIIPLQMCSCILRILDQPQSKFYDFNKQKTFLKVYIFFDVPAFRSWSAGYSEG